MTNDQTLEEKLRLAHEGEEFHQKRADDWKAVAERQAARVREIQVALEAKRELVTQSGKAIESMSKRVYTLDQEVERLKTALELRDKRIDELKSEVRNLSADLDSITDGEHQ